MINFEVFTNDVKSGGLGIGFANGLQSYEIENCGDQELTQETLSGKENNWMITHHGGMLTIYCNGNWLKEIDLSSCADGSRWEDADSIQFTDMDTASIKFTGKSALVVDQSPKVIDGCPITSIENYIITTND